MSFTTDPKDPELGHGVDDKPIPQHKKYLVLPDGGEYIRPYRTTYVHGKCGVATTMNGTISATYAKNPKFYGSTYCVGCRKHLPVSEFKWKDGEVVGS
jgi:hypothetical protein